MLMKKHFVFLSMLLLAVSCSDPTNDITLVNSPEGNFESLWKTIDQQYCYLGQKGIDWDSVHTAYLPRVQELESKDPASRELFDLMTEMLNLLNDGHVNLYSDFDVSRAIGWYENYPENFNSSLIYSERYLGQDYKRAGGLYYEKIGEEKVGYIRYDSFASSFSSANLWHVFDYFKECEGVIIDVRNNGGGNLNYANSLASAFFTQQTTVGYIQHKTGPGHNDFSEPEARIISPHKSCQWQRPVVVLINRQSYSATNEFACSMQYAPLATLMGGISGGGGGIPLSYELPNGWVVRFSAVPMYDAEMNPIEDGIAPDIEVELTDSAIAQGEDNIIEEAIRHITNQQK